MNRLVLIACMLLCGSGIASAADSVLAETVSALTVRVNQLDAESQPGSYADLERLRARQAIAQITEVRSRDRDDAIDNAEVLIKIADISIKIQQLNTQLTQLDRDRDGIYVEASRRDAELARKEAEQLRLKVLAFEEEQANPMLANEQIPEPSQIDDSASQAQTQRVVDAKAKEAELARLEEEITAQMSANANSVLKTKSNNGKNRYTLQGTAFEPGKSKLTVSAKTILKVLAERVKASSKDFIIQGYCDDLGNEKNNIHLTKQRADAVAAVFIAAGLKASRIQAEGLGSSNPVASNKTQAGRAQNRRIEIY